MEWLSGFYLCYIEMLEIVIILDSSLAKSEQFLIHTLNLHTNVHLETVISHFKICTSKELAFHLGKPVYPQFLKQHKLFLIPS